MKSKITLERATVATCLRKRKLSGTPSGILQLAIGFALHCVKSFENEAILHGYILQSFGNQWLNVGQIKFRESLNIYIKSHKPGPCFGEGAVSGPNSNSTWEPLAAGGADTAEYPDSLDWYPR